MTRTEELTKKYADCEAAFDAAMLGMSTGWKDAAPADRLAFQIVAARALAVQAAYENKLLRDGANTAEMHQLLARMEGK